jgi:hypothetical protein
LKIDDPVACRREGKSRGDGAQIINLKDISLMSLLIASNSAEIDVR